MKATIKYELRDNKHGTFRYTLENEEKTKWIDVEPEKVKELIEDITNASVDEFDDIVTDAEEICIGDDYNIRPNEVITGYNDLYSYCMKIGRLDVIEAYSLADNNLPMNKIAGRSYKTFIKLKCTECSHITKIRAIYSNRVHTCEMCAAKAGKGITLIQGGNDIETWCKENNRLDILADYSSDNELPPNQVSQKSHKKVDWKCTKELSDGTVCNHEWSTPVSHRTGSNNGCPACSARAGVGTTMVTGVNDLKTWCTKNNRQDIIENWVDTKPIDKVSAKTDEINVVVKCKVCGDSIITKPYSLVRSETSTLCVKCKVSGTSVPQLMLYKVLLGLFGDTEYRKKIQGYEADIYIPSIGLAIEYNGVWHLEKDKAEYDEEKINIFKSLGIRTLTIQEYGSSEFTPIRQDENTLNIWYKYNRDIGMYRLVLGWIGGFCESKGLVGLELRVTKEDVENAINTANSHMTREKVVGCLAETHPELAAEWDHAVNEGITPENVTYGSHQEVYWKCNKCEKPHLYKMTVHKRGSAGRGCPYLAGKSVLAGLNDLYTKAPEFMKYCWYKEGNEELGMNPLELTVNSRKTIAIRCPHCNSTWENKVANVVGSRIAKGKGAKCPFCKSELPLT